MDFFDSDLDSENPYDHLKYKLDEWTKHAVTFNELFHKNKIYFTLKQVTIMNSIDSKMHNISSKTNAFLVNFTNSKEQLKAIVQKSPEYIALKESFTQLIEETMTIEKILEDEFRILLGIEIK